MFNDIMLCARRSLGDSQVKFAFWLLLKNHSTSTLWLLVVQKTSPSSLWKSKDNIDCYMRCAFPSPVGRRTKPTI